jgi:prophage maintenance system killer protein
MIILYTAFFVVPIYKSFSTILNCIFFNMKNFQQQLFLLIGVIFLSTPSLIAQTNLNKGNSNVLAMASATNSINSNQSNASLSKEKNKPKIVLKLDDFDAKNGVSASSPAMEYLMNKQIKASIGFIASRCDESVLSVYTPFLNSSNEKGEKLFEVWHHGFDHINPEFDGTGYDYQKTHFDKADQLMTALLRLQMHSFGSPFNHNDEETNKVLAENSNYKITMFNKPQAAAETGILNLNNRVNMESATGKPNFDFFVKNYNDKVNSYADYMVLQGHPKFWKTEEMTQFIQIIDFLVSNGNEFVLPYDYYLSLNSSIKIASQSQTINFPTLTNKKMGDKDFEISAKANSGLEVLYNSSNHSVATILNGKVHIVGIGKTIITASQMGNSIYKPSNYVSRNLTVQ